MATTGGGPNCVFIGSHTGSQLAIMGGPLRPSPVLRGRLETESPEPPNKGLTIDSRWPICIRWIALIAPKNASSLNHSESIYARAGTQSSGLSSAVTF